MKLDKVEIADLGQARKVVSSKDNTTIVDGKGSDNLIKERVEKIKKEKELSDSDFDKQKVQERLAKLSGGVAVIKVGAATETEMKEKKFRIEDALNATKAAVEEGIVSGGGVALVRAKSQLESITSDSLDETTGIKILARAIEEPLRQIVENAGQEGSVVASKVLEGKDDFGYNAKTDEYTNMLSAGIIDPTKVTRIALENAASVSGVILTTASVLVEIKEDSPAGGAMPPMGGGMPGMM